MNNGTDLILEHWEIKLGIMITIMVFALFWLGIWIWSTREGD